MGRPRRRIVSRNSSLREPTQKTTSQSQTQPQMSSTQPQMSSTQPQMSSTQPQMSSTQSKMSSTQSKMSLTNSQSPSALSSPLHSSSREYPCGICLEECIGDSDIGCDMCQQWFHMACEHLSTAEFKYLNSSDLPYLCSKCTLTSNSRNFDFTASLERLNKFKTNDKKLQQAAKVERILLRNNQAFTYGSVGNIQFNNWALTTDVTASSLLGSNWKGSVPVSVTGDGNCFFNALSVALTGHEGHSTELRLRTALELIQHKECYVQTNLGTNLELCSPDISVAVKDCITNKSFSSAWTINAAATVIEKQIKSVYPVVNGPSDQCIGILNRIFHPREGACQQIKEQVTIMWTGPYVNSSWTPNHFVPLLNSGSDKCHVLDLNDEEEFPSLNTSASLASQVSPLPVISKAQRCKPVQIKKESSKSQKNHLSSPLELSSIMSQDDIFSASSDLDKMSDSSGMEDDSKVPQEDLDVTSLSDIDQPYKNPVVNSLQGKFLTAEKQFEILQTPVTKEQDIPRGVKQDVYFLLDDCKNTSRRLAGKKSEYPDDCGSWKQGGNVTKSEYFLKTQIGIQSIKRNKDGVFFRIIRKKNVPLSPQPDNDQVICLKRKYSVLARQEGYKKRITWFEGGPYEGVAFAEYIGKYPENTPSIHGNAKSHNRPYQRLSNKQKAVIHQGLEENRQPREIKADVRSALPEQTISLKTARNAKYHHEKQKHPEDKQNLADDIITLLNQAYEDPSYIKEVITSSHQKPPNVICYSDEQLMSLRSAVSNGCVLGIDRTFNVGSCYLTVITFKNSNFLRIETSEAPIMQGPVFLHWDGNYHTYQRFLSHLQSKLSDLDQSKIIFGSDGEKALLNAIRTCFPNAVQTLCTRHLKENLTHNLRKTLPQPEATAILNKIFNRQSGLLSMDNEIGYNEVEREILEQHDEPYLLTFLRTLKKYIFLPRSRCRFYDIPKFWTNNNNESYNNIIKLETNWQIQKLPQLIDKLHNLDISQTQNLRDALHHRGDFRVTGPAENLRVSDEVWTNMTQDQRNRRLMRLLNFTQQKNVIQSSDKTLTIPKVAAIAKKPGQKKRVKSCKSRTAPKRRKLEKEETNKRIE